VALSSQSLSMCHQLAPLYSLEIKNLQMPGFDE